ncbi:hypothetical protein D6C92_04665 [Aureobasidium pullulans]|nr:hypothetical protein D6C92_04665 [Aureobasidium pullulans]
MEDHLEHLIAARNDMNRIVRDMLASYDNANAQQKIRMRSIIHDSLSLAASCDSILENWQTMRRSIHRGDVSLSEEALTNAIDASYEIGYAQGLYAYGYFYYGPAVDGRIIQDLPSQELEAGNLAKVPLITDHTSFERAGFSNLSTRTLQ